MKLYYCWFCGMVAAFNLFDIQKHDLEKPETRTCPVCNSFNCFRLLELE